MKRLLLPLTLGLLFSLTACTPKAEIDPNVSATPSPTATASPSPTASLPVSTPTPAPAPAPVWGEQTASCVQPHPDKPDVALVSGEFSLPYIENADGIPAYTAVNNWYGQLMEGLKGDTMANVGQARDDYETSQALGDAFAGYSDEETFEITFEDTDTVGILRTHYGHTGGPYPTLLYMADRFDLKTGIPLHFADFFSDAAGAEELVRAEVLRQAAEFADYDQAAAATAFSRENFYLTAEGFVFFYQPQTLNPQAATKPEFLVSYNLLEGLLNR